MKLLNATQTAQVSGGTENLGNSKELNTAFQIERAVQAASGTTTMNFSPSHREGMPVHLTRFDANFTAPRDNDSEEQPLFPGLNDQGGVV